MEQLQLLNNYDLSNMTDQIMRNRLWKPDFTIRVAEEYKKFMFLRSNNPYLRASGIIDSFWRQHILNTKSYQDFCMVNFNKFIHYRQQDQVGIYTPVNAVSETIRAHYSYFKEIIDKDVCFYSYPTMGFIKSGGIGTGPTGPC